MAVQRFALDENLCAAAAADVYKRQVQSRSICLAISDVFTGISHFQIAVITSSSVSGSLFSPLIFFTSTFVNIIITTFFTNVNVFSFTTRKDVYKRQVG